MSDKQCGAFAAASKAEAEVDLKALKDSGGLKHVTAAVVSRNE